MLRSTLFVFIAGWVLWFWIDKPDPRNIRMPPRSESVVENFQTAFNMLKSGYPELSFLYIWNAHYLILSILGGLILLSLFQSVVRFLRRGRMRRDYLPQKQTEKPQHESVEKETGDPGK